MPARSGQLLGGSDRPNADPGRDRARCDVPPLLVELAGFRDYVFRSLGNRLADVTNVLEQVAFVKVEAREQVVAVVRAGAGLGVVLHRKDRLAIDAQARVRAVEQRDMGLR